MYLRTILASVMLAVTALAADPAPLAAAPTPPAEVAKVLEMPEGKERSTALAAALKPWIKQDTVAVLTWAAAQKLAVAKDAISICGREQPKTTADWLMKNDTKRSYTHGVGWVWGMNDPAASLAWCQALPADAPEKFRGLIVFSITDGWARKDVTACAPMVMKLQPVDYVAGIEGFALLGRGQVQKMSDWIKTLPQEHRYLAAKVILDSWKSTPFNKNGTKDAAAIAAWLEPFGLTAEQKDRIEKDPPIRKNGL